MSFVCVSVVAALCCEIKSIYNNFLSALSTSFVVYIVTTNVRSVHYSL